MFNSLIPRLFQLASYSHHVLLKYQIFQYNIFLKRKENKHQIHVVKMMRDYFQSVSHWHLRLRNMNLVSKYVFSVGYQLVEMVAWLILW